MECAYEIMSAERSFRIARDKSPLVGKRKMDEQATSRNIEKEEEGEGEGEGEE